ncbi:hypothetical protein HPO_01280 [Hyphomonas polymorpha PS728]|uniref:Uncharacterized protein n=1 Tax=Hyphomonas polymorpha PS728 TaxID=1280954 RepID=A0A062VQQ2_9PROT|nr:hypothetical protein [Hyphomonas polymorpha]KDA00619.1 hypothetical protein HPO_01280 [Hyphomonas polymorpha PS728]
MQTLLPAMAIAAAAGLSGLAGFLDPRVDLMPEADSLLASWSSPPVPADYSGSRDRIVFDLAGLSLFGKAPEQARPAGAEATAEPPLKLIAIARLNGKAIAMIDEGKPLPVRLSAGQTTSTEWRVATITDNEVTLERGGQARTLTLFPAAN